MNGRLEFHVPFLEAAVQAAVDADPRAPIHHRDREAVYAIEDPETRDRAFGRLAAEWFRRLDLDAPIRQALTERSADLSTVGRILVGPAGRARDTGADLLVPAGGRSTLVIRILPADCRNKDHLLTLMRRELLHIADMLDPAFRYEPRLPPQPAGPAHDRLIQDRYRLLWDCSVDGRLVRAGLLPGTVHDLRLREYRRIFGEPARACAEVPAFGVLFHGPRPSHPVLASIAALRSSRTTPAHRCSLCGFPTTSVVANPAGLPAPVLDTIRRDFPGWGPGKVLCVQCADLYRARAAASTPDLDPVAIGTPPAAGEQRPEGRP